MENTSKEVDFSTVAGFWYTRKMFQRQIKNSVKHLNNIIIVNGFQLKSSVKLFDRLLLNLLFYLYFSIKRNRSNNYWPIIDAIETRTTPSAFTCSKSTIETIR